MLRIGGREGSEWSGAQRGVGVQFTKSREKENTIRGGFGELTNGRN